MKLVLLGGTYSKGISKKDGKPYEMAEIYYGKKPRSWKTEKGECISFGFGVGEVNDGKIEKPQMAFVYSSELLKKCETTAFPVFADVVLEPNPEDPNKNLIVDFSVIKSLFDDLHKK
ncbi:hypothetical protein [Vibrio bathopelagicus]|uniref:hypothetical protein n=1 Tax=Vibrio bathopelagicus TaxID=2777577 RepID=UPI001863BF7C|nr:hypothetical protein [Vibrio bathopelagicus]